MEKKKKREGESISSRGRQRPTSFLLCHTHPYPVGGKREGGKRGRPSQKGRWTTAVSPSLNNLYYSGIVESEEEEKRRGRSHGKGETPFLF